MKLYMVGILGMVLSGCLYSPHDKTLVGSHEAPLPNSSRIVVAKSDPPLGASELGSIEAVHGNGCNGYGLRGTFDGAMIILRNTAQLRGANYVMLISTLEPHQELGCYDDRFMIRGLAYRLPTQTPAQPSPVAAPALSPAASQGQCNPPCSPGYQCSNQTCVALCNPTCGAGQICRQDRTCAAAPAAPLVAPAPPPAR